MLKFKTKVSCIYSEHMPVACNPGNPEIDLYDSKYDDDGELIVFKSGKSNLQDYINSFAAACDINNIVARYMNGEIPDFDFVKGSYLDVTGMPTSFADMVNRVKEGTDTFNSLPVEIKERFDNDPVKFYSSFGSKEFLDIMGVSDNSTDIPVEPIVDSEVKVDE